MRILDPRNALRELGVYGAQHVVDLGAGAGHFALLAAERLEGGRLFAVDLERDMLARLVSEAESRGHKNVHVLWGDASRVAGVPLADAALDRAIAASVLFQVDDRNGFVQEARRLLRPGGKILVVEWRTNAPGGPHPHHRISAEVMTALFSRHGFTKESDIDAGDLQYGMIFVRP